MLFFFIKFIIIIYKYIEYYFNMEFNVLYCIDENKKDFSRYLWVSILSLLEKNKDEDVHIYILTRYIEDSNKQELIKIVNNFWKKISFSDYKDEIIPEKFKSILTLSWNWPIATYYRFFFNYLFNIKDRLLYLDCDTIINKNLSEFYNSDFKWNVIIWTNDVSLFERERKHKLWLENYINAGVFLLDINLFEKYNLYSEFKVVNKKFKKLEYNDQDYINLVFKDKIKIYKYLQYVYCFKYMHDFDNYLIIHTVNKPNTWYTWLCWKDIESLFNQYLIKTKWSSYVWYSKEKTLRTYLSNMFNNIKFFLIYYTYKFFWPRCSNYVRLFFIGLFNIVSNFLKKHN